MPTNDTKQKNALRHASPENPKKSQRPRSFVFAGNQSIFQDCYYTCRGLLAQPLPLALSGEPTSPERSCFWPTPSPKCFCTLKTLAGPCQEPFQNGRRTHCRVQKTVLSALNVSVQPQSPTLEPLQARCTLNTPAPMNTCEMLKTLAGVALFNIRPHCRYPFHPEHSQTTKPENA